MRRIMLSSAACLSIPQFSTLAYKRDNFREIVTEYNMCVWILSTNFV
jgi:hypothetical protein